MLSLLFFTSPPKITKLISIFFLPYNSLHRISLNLTKQRYLKRMKLSIRSFKLQVILILHSFFTFFPQVLPTTSLYLRGNQQHCNLGKNMRQYQQMADLMESYIEIDNLIGNEDITHRICYTFKQVQFSKIQYNKSQNPLTEMNGDRKQTRLSKSPHQVPILAPQQIQKLQLLKRASIHNEQIRRSIRPSQQHKTQQHKKSLKPKDNTNNDSQDTKLYADDSWGNQAVRKRRVAHEDEETNGGGCCNLFKKEEKIDNPFKAARKTIQKY